VSWKETWDTLAIIARWANVVVDPKTMMEKLPSPSEVGLSIKDRTDLSTAED
jgi:hypothetical protein